MTQWQRLAGHFSSRLIVKGSTTGRVAKAGSSIQKQADGQGHMKCDVPPGHLGWLPPLAAPAQRQRLPSHLRYQRWAPELLGGLHLEEAHAASPLHRGQAETLSSRLDTHILQRRPAHLHKEILRHNVEGSPADSPSVDKGYSKRSCGDCLEGPIKPQGL